MRQEKLSRREISRSVGMLAAVVMNNRAFPVRRREVKPKTVSAGVFT